MVLRELRFTAGLVAADALLAMPALSLAAEPASNPDVLEGRRANLPGQVHLVPRARFDRPDVAQNVSGRASVGPFDQGPCRRPSDAAVAHRQVGRHSALQERHVAQRQADSDDRRTGWIRAPSRATPPTCPR